MDLPEPVTTLGLLPHPEGGWYRETWRSEHLTAIDFLLAAGTYSAWHRVHGAEEVWSHTRGGRIRLHLLDAAGHRTIDLGGDVAHAVVPAGCWQAAELIDGDWGQVACVVAPPFTFERFELAGPGLTGEHPDHAQAITALLPERHRR